MDIIANQITAKLTFKGPTNTKGAHWKLEMDYGDKPKKIGQLGAHSFKGFNDLVQAASQIIAAEVSRARAVWGGKPYTPQTVNASYYGNTTIFLMMTE